MFLFWRKLRRKTCCLKFRLTAQSWNLYTLDWWCVRKFLLVCSSEENCLLGHKQITDKSEQRCNAIIDFSCLLLLDAYSEMIRNKIKSNYHQSQSDRFVLIFITVIRHNFIHLWATLALEKFIDSKIDGHFNTILKMKCQIEWTKKKLSLNISLQLKALNLFVFCLIYLKHFLLSQIHCWTETIKKKKRILAHLTLLVAHT